MTTGIDAHTDAQVAAVATLLHGAIRAKHGADNCAHVYQHPMQPGLVPAAQYPCLSVYRLADQQESADVGEDVETVTLRIDYYAPITPADRIALRWPLLRAIWKFCVVRLRQGRDPAVEDGASLLADAGFAVPAPVTGRVTYQTAQAEGVLQPCFTGTITLRMTAYADFDDELDDLQSIATTATLEDDAHAPAFDALVDDLDQDGIDDDA